MAEDREVAPAPESSPTTLPSSSGAVPAEVTSKNPVGEPAPPAAARETAPLTIKRTRTSATYVGLAVGIVVLILVLIFVTQNLHEANVHFITLHLKLPQGVIVLAAAVAGGLVVLLVSLARVFQLRLTARRHTRQHRRGPE